MKVVTLRDGSQEPEVTVIALMMSLDNLMKKKPIAFFEAVSLARNPSHRLFGNINEILQRLALTDGQGKMHSSIRTIIRNAVTGDGPLMSLHSPINQNED